jgi:hypothetical protein
MIIIFNNIIRRSFLFVKVPTKIFFFFLFAAFSLAGAFTPVSRGQRFPAFFYSSWPSPRCRKYSSIVIKRGDLWAGTAFQHAPEKGKS